MVLNRVQKQEASSRQGQSLERHESIKGLSKVHEQLIVTHNGKKLYTEQRSDGYSVNCQVYMVYLSR